jgi:F-type H+-transporting ATPase subunit delta
MSELTVAARYAKALIDLAEEQKSVEAVNGDMDLFYRTLKANPELKAVLANPIVSHVKKIKILDEVFADKVSKVSIAFFKLMINKSRGEVLYTTAQEYTNLYDEKMHIIKANVVSASELSTVNRKTIIADLEKVTKAKIKLETKVDPSLIGGFVLTIGGRQIDTSIANDLRILKKEFAQKVNAN